MHSESPFIETLLSDEPSRFDRPIEDLCADRDLEGILSDCAALEDFRRETANLYLRVRALIFLYHLHRFVLPGLVESSEMLDTRVSPGTLDPRPIPLHAHRALQARNFTEAIDLLLAEGEVARLNFTLSSGLATAYHALALQSLADQVRRSVRQETGNQWMFRIGHPDDFPLRARKELLGPTGGFPWLIEQTPVRMDLSHSSWSDIFFLGMDRPEFAKVINTSIDLAVTGSPTGPVPPCLGAFRIIDQPMIRLVSIDLECMAEVTDLPALFDFGRDYLGLLKAAVIASGLVPPGMEGSRTALERLLARFAGPGRGFELVSWVRDIPKGSRLAVSTNLLGSLISTCMRASGQIGSLEGSMTGEERRVVASRAILGEWLGGSGGGWQDSGGVWPGVKLIEGCFSDGRIADPLSPSSGRGNAGGVAPGQPDAEAAQARGALLPRHTRLDGAFIPEASLEALERSLILIHGGMAANVGPILEMVTERYLLRSRREWGARRESLACTKEILEALRAGDMRALGKLTTAHFHGPLKTIIPWASNAFTERLIETVANELGDRFWGFWMLGGMSGGGMGLIVDPGARDAAKPVLQQVLIQLKKACEKALPFAMDPVIYDFRINPAGSTGLMIGKMDTTGGEGAGRAFLREYFRLQLPTMLRKPPAGRSPQEHHDLNRIRSLAGNYSGDFLASLLPEAENAENGSCSRSESLDALLERHGFDRLQHEQIRDDLQAGRVGLSQNRLHPKTLIEDVPRESLRMRDDPAVCRRAGEAALRDGECLVLTLAAGAGSRWTQGAGVVKALHPFAPLNGVFRSFLELHAAKSFLSARQAGARIPHVITTSYLTHEPIKAWLDVFRSRFPGINASVDLRVSEGRSVGLRLVPTARDLHYAWYELPQEKLDEQAEKMRDSVRHALIRWARDTGEGSDYRDNLPLQCLHPVGHWYELPNLFLNGSLHRLLREYPRLRTLLLHNIDTVGASLDPVLLGHHLLSKAPLTYEVIRRRFDDVGGGLARVNGTVRLVEGFALPREEDEFSLSFYNTLTTWIDLDALLGRFGLERADFLTNDTLPGGSGYPRIREAVRTMAARMPTYITLKETKKRWGRGQEDVFPVLQFERLWGDMSAHLAREGSGRAGFVEVDRMRGQQLKDPAQLDAWSREGNLERLESWLGKAF